MVDEPNGGTGGIPGAPGGGTTGAHSSMKDSSTRSTRATTTKLAKSAAAKAAIPAKAARKASKVAGARTTPTPAPTAQSRSTVSAIEEQIVRATQLGARLKAAGSPLAQGDGLAANLLRPALDSLEAQMRGLGLAGTEALSTALATA